MTNAVLEAIAARRSVRAYTDEQISQEALDTLLTAAQQAPSARNLQPWHVTVVQNAELLTRINECVRKGLVKGAQGEMRRAFEAPAYSVFYHAPTVFFLSTDMSGEKLYARHDCGCMSQTIALAAQSMGLGSVILGMPREAFTGDEADEMRALLRFPKGYDFMVAVAVGHPAGTKDAHPVLEDRVVLLR